MPCLYVESHMSLGFLCCFQQCHNTMHCADFVENTLFKCSSDIILLPSSLLALLSMNKETAIGSFQED